MLHNFLQSVSARIIVLNIIGIVLFGYGYLGGYLNDALAGPSAPVIYFFGLFTLIAAGFMAAGRSKPARWLYEHGPAMALIGTVAGFVLAARGIQGVSDPVQIMQNVLGGMGLALYSKIGRAHV